MLVKCRLCGKKIEKEIAFCAPNGGGRFYYCNEDEFKAKEKEKVKKIEDKEEAKKNKPKKEPKIDPVYEEIANIFGYRIQNSALFKEMKLWRNICNDEKILAYLQENRDYIKKSLSRLNSNEYARIRYVSAILKNSLHDFEIKVEPQKIKVDSEIYEPVAKTRNRRRGLADIEDEV